MKTANLVLHFIEVLVWPLLIGSILVLFRKSIRSRLGDLTELKVGNLVSAKLSKRRMNEVAKETASEINEMLPATAKLSSEEQKELEKFVASQLQPMVPSLAKTISPETPVDSLPVDPKDSTMLAVAVGTSAEDNRRYKIYYDPVDRTHATPFRYLGFYCDKTIFAVGEVEEIAYCDLVDGKLIGKNGFQVAKLSETQKSRIIDAINAAREYEYEIATGHKFFLLKDFEDTDFAKTSKYPLQSKRYFWLSEIDGFRSAMPSKELAELLEGKSWE